MLLYRVPGKLIREVPWGTEGEIRELIVADVRNWATLHFLLWSCMPLIAEKNSCDLGMLGLRSLAYMFISTLMHVLFVFSEVPEWFCKDRR